VDRRTHDSEARFGLAVGRDVFNLPPWFTANATGIDLIDKRYVTDVPVTVPEPASSRRLFLACRSPGYAGGDGV
jgi:hypothetical protein